jgi:transmembrane sensor
MNPLRQISLLLKKRNEALTTSEEEALQSWLGEAENSQLADEIDRLWESSSQYQSAYEPDVEAGLQRLKATIRSEASGTAPSAMAAKKRRLIPRVWQAAAALALLLGMVVVYKLVLSDSNAEPMVLVNDSEEPQSYTLPDGSIVFLNGNTRLSYPENLAEADVRTVTLSGEAFFEIAADEAHPFHIYTEHARVEVVGTAFNLRAMPGEDFTEVEVEEGIVHFVAPKLRQRTEQLQAKEKAIIRHGKQLERTRVTALNARSWQTGRLNFRKTAVKSVLQTVERHFDVSIDATQSSIQQCTFNTNFKEASLEEVLENFRVIFNVRVKRLSPGQYQLIGGGC